MRRSAAVVGVLTVAVVVLALFMLGRPAPSEEMVAAVGEGQLALLAGQDVTVYKSPTCSCCNEYETYLEQYGMVVESVIVPDPVQYKAAGLAAQYWSCHTSVVAGYTVEGHVPVEVIAKLLAEAPDMGGITLPGMPAGSPGMAGVKNGTWTIFGVTDGRTVPFMYY